jgi:hypothetical protein
MAISARAPGRWPVLAGGQDTLRNDRPEKTIGSYWPYLSTVFDYVRRAMPFGDARSLSDDDVYALTAYLLYLNDVVDDEEFELSKENFASVRLPNEANFIPDDRASEPHYAKSVEPCMTECKPGPVEITARAQVHRRDAGRRRRRELRRRYRLTRMSVGVLEGIPGGETIWRHMAGTDGTP